MAISRKSRFRAALWLVLLGLCLTQGVHAQEGGDKAAEKPQTADKPVPIPVSEIPGRAESLQGLLRSITPRLAPAPQVKKISAQVESAASEIDRLSQAKEMQNLDDLSLRGLQGLKRRWQTMADQLTDWQRTVTNRAATLTGFSEQIQAQETLWKLTLASREQLQIPDALVGQIRSVLSDIEEANKRLRDRLDQLLTEVSRISALSVRVANVVSTIEDAETANRGRLLVREADPLWSVLFRSKPEKSEADGAEPPEPADAQDVIGDELSSAWFGQLEQVSGYLGDNGDRLLAHILMFAGLAGLLVLLNRRRARWSKLENGSEVVVDIIGYPFATAALISLLFTRTLYPGAPLALFDVSRLILVIPILVLLRQTFSDRQRITLYSLLGLFVVDVVRGLLQTQPLSGRLSLLVVTALGLAAMIRAVTADQRVMVSPHGPWEKMGKLFARISVFTLAGSIVANLAGIVALGELLGEATIIAIFAGFGLYALSLVLMGLLDLFLQSPAGSRIRAFRRNVDLIHRRVGRAINMLAIVAWLIFTLGFFKIWSPVWDALVWLFSTSLAVGAFEISLGDIFGFIVAIWLGIQISRFICFILDEDVFTRVRLPRGVPATISMMVNYGVVTIAFVIALAVAGFDLSRFAIIAGALSVGIGFGLQNVVNNFVSGLILAFERPISVGDSVEMGTLWGRVRHIGVRSSVVRTFDGSEVIVPNADFISKEVINWTLSDVSRRLAVPVGVAYGSDPHQVIDLLVRVAKESPDVMQDPEPFALFIGFGDSSLDFELRAWCDFNEGLRIKTQLNLGIHDALKEAGIEIPFPQRDLHLRSVDAEAGRALASQHTQARPVPPAQPEPESAGRRRIDTPPIPSEGE